MSKLPFADSANPNQAIQMVSRAADLTLTHYTPKTTKDADKVLNNLLESCKVLGVPTESQEELLIKIIDKAAETENKALYDVALDKFHGLVSASEGPPPLSADFGGRQPIMH